MKTLQKGFTLIELMIVVAIVGILAAIALPAYQEYIARSKISEGLALLAGAKTSVTEFVASNGRLPIGTSEAGINTAPSSTKYISAMGFDGDDATSTMRISATLVNINATLNTYKIGMQGTYDVTTSEVKWDCVTNVDSANFKFLPSNCRSRVTTGAMVYP